MGGNNLISDWATVGKGKQGDCGTAPQFSQRQTHGRQARVSILRDGKVTETNHGKILRDRKPPLSRCLDGSEGSQVTGADESGR